MSNPRLTNLNGTNSTDYLPLWQMPVTYYQALSILITAILVKLNERPLPRFRSLLATACALLPGATVRKTTSLHLQLAYQARSLYSLALAHPFFLASSGEAAGFLFVTERMRLFSAPHPQLSLITLLFRARDRGGGMGVADNGAAGLLRKPLSVKLRVPPVGSNRRERRLSDR
jgi:hypothetical protein